MYGRIFVLEEDIRDLPRNIDFDEVVTISDIESIFLAGGEPEMMTLIISKEYLDTSAALYGPGVTATPGHTPVPGDILVPGPTPGLGTSLAILRDVLEREHMLFVLGSSSNHIFHQLGLWGTIPSYDPGGEPVFGFDFPEDSMMVYGGSGILFQSDNPDVKWTVFESGSFEW